MSNVLARFHRALVDEIRSKRPDYLRGPFTVAEIYQDLVPYRTHRDDIGVEMNGDYEDALLRLLAGEGDYLVLESEHALRELREELESSNPNTGVYREFAAVDVRLNQARLGSDELGASYAGPPQAQTTLSVEDLAPTPASSRAEAQMSLDAVDEAPARVQAPAAVAAVADEESPEEDPPAAEPVRATEEEAAAADSDVPACRWCRAELPQRDTLNFCPYCGTDVHVVPCPACGEELEPEWRFCVACGTEVTG